MQQESTTGVPGQVVTRVPTRDGRIAVEQRGDPGAPSAVVFLHGLTANRSTWHAVTGRLGASHRLLLVDFLSRGESDAAPCARYDLESESCRLDEVLRCLHVRQPVLVGHSHGAAVGVAVASRTGARALLLANPVTPRIPRPALLAALDPKHMRIWAPSLIRLFRRPLTRYMLVRRVFTGVSGLPAGAVDRYAQPWAEPERARSLPAVLAGWDPTHLEPWASDAGIPVRVLAGGSDRRIDPIIAEEWATTLGGTFSLLAGCGHALPEEEPAVMAEALRELLETV